MAFPFFSPDFRWLPLSARASFNHSNALVDLCLFVLLFNHRVHSLLLLEKKNQTKQLVTLHLVHLLLYMFPRFPEIHVVSFSPFVTEESINMMSCIHVFVVKHHSNHYKYSVQMLDKFWLQQIQVALVSSRKAFVS